LTCPIFDPTEPPGVGHGLPSPGTVSMGQKDPPLLGYPQK
jgi:hypothetical protein